MVQVNRQRKCYSKYWLLLLIPLLSACSHDMSGLQQDIDHTIRNTRGYRIKPAPRYVQIEPFIYVPTNRDPFASPRKRRPGVINPGNAKNCNGPVILAKRRREPLEQYPLKTLQMVGTIKRKATRWALLRTKDGTIHRVRASNYVGQNHGKIVNITDTMVEISEIVENRGVDDEDSGCPYRARKAKLELSN